VWLLSVLTKLLTSAHVWLRSLIQPSMYRLSYLRITMQSWSVAYASVGMTKYQYVGKYEHNQILKRLTELQAAVHTADSQQSHNSVKYTITQFQTWTLTCEIMRTLTCLILSSISQ